MFRYVRLTHPLQWISFAQYILFTKKCIISPLFTVFCINTRFNFMLKRKLRRTSHTVTFESDLRFHWLCFSSFTTGCRHSQGIGRARHAASDRDSEDNWPTHTTGILSASCVLLQLSVEWSVEGEATAVHLSLWLTSSEKRKHYYVPAEMFPAGLQWHGRPTWRPVWCWAPPSPCSSSWQSAATCWCAWPSTPPDASAAWQTASYCRWPWSTCCSASWSSPSRRSWSWATTGLWARPSATSTSPWTWCCARPPSSRCWSSAWTATWPWACLWDTPPWCCRGESLWSWPASGPCRWPCPSCPSRWAGTPSTGPCRIRVAGIRRGGAASSWTDPTCSPTPSWHSTCLWWQCAGSTCESYASRGRRPSASWAPSAPASPATAAGATLPPRPWWSQGSRRRFCGSTKPRWQWRLWSERLWRAGCPISSCSRCWDWRSTPTCTTYPSIPLCCGWGIPTQRLIPSCTRPSTGTSGQPTATCCDVDILLVTARGPIDQLLLHRQVKLQRDCNSCSWWHTRVRRRWSFVINKNELEPASMSPYPRVSPTCTLTSTLIRP